MKIVISPSNNPYFNLALEEYLFNVSTDDFFLLYINQPSVICGKHQIPCKEINIPFVDGQDILVCRRFSGGGTVYHDMGNLNFCYITTHSKIGIDVDFKKFIRPIFDFLNLMGISARINERNNILIDGKKISGNAEHLTKKRTLHHGTLLFSTDLKILDRVLESNYSHYHDKSVKSVEAKVTNILPYLSSPINIQIFRNYLVDYMLKKFDGELVDLHEQEMMAVFRLSLEKYSQTEWIYGYSPVYTVKKSFKRKNLNVEFSIYVEKGKIKTFQVVSDDRKVYSKVLSKVVDNYHIPVYIGEIIESDPELKKNVNVYSFF